MSVNPLGSVAGKILAGGVARSNVGGVTEDGRTNYNLPISQIFYEDLPKLKDLTDEELAKYAESAEAQDLIFESYSQPRSVNYSQDDSQVQQIIQNFGGQQRGLSGVSGRNLFWDPIIEANTRSEEDEEIYYENRNNILKENLDNLQDIAINPGDIQNLRDIATMAMTWVESDDEEVVMYGQQILHTFKDYEPFKDLIGVQTNYKTSFDDLYEAPPKPNAFMSLVGWAFDKVLAPQQALFGMVLDVRDGNWSSLSSRLVDFGLDMAQLPVQMFTYGQVEPLKGFENWLEDHQSDTSKYDIDADGRIGFREAFGIDQDWANDWKIPLPFIQHFSVGNIVDFTGEVVTDPLSWVTMGAGGAGKQAIKAGGSAIDDMLRVGAKDSLEQLGYKGVASELAPEQLEFVLKGTRNALENRVPWKKFVGDMDELFFKQYGVRLPQGAADDLLEMAFKRAPYSSNLGKQAALQQKSAKLTKKFGEDNPYVRRIDDKIKQLGDEMGNLNLAEEAVGKSARRIKKNMELIDRRLGGGFGFGAGRKVAYIPQSRNLYQVFKRNGLTVTPSKFFRGTRLLTEVFKRDVKGISSINELLEETHMAGFAADIIQREGSGTVDVETIQRLWRNRAANGYGEAGTKGYARAKERNQTLTTGGHERLHPHSQEGPRDLTGNLVEELTEPQAQRVLDILTDAGFLKRRVVTKGKSRFDRYDQVRNRRSPKQVQRDIGDTLARADAPRKYPIEDLKAQADEAHAAGRIDEAKRLDKLVDDLLEEAASADPVLAGIKVVEESRQAETIADWLNNPFGLAPPAGKTAEDLQAALLQQIETNDDEILNLIDESGKLVEQASKAADQAELDQINRKLNVIDEKIEALHGLNQEYVNQGLYIQRGIEKYIDQLTLLERATVPDLRDFDDLATPAFIMDYEIGGNAFVDDDGLTYVTKFESVGNDAGKKAFNLEFDNFYPDGQPVRLEEARQNFGAMTNRTKPQEIPEKLGPQRNRDRKKLEDEIKEVGRRKQKALDKGHGDVAERLQIEQNDLQRKLRDTPPYVKVTKGDRLDKRTKAWKDYKADVMERRPPTGMPKTHDPLVREAYIDTYVENMYFQEMLGMGLLDPQGVKAYRNRLIAAQKENKWYGVKHGVKTEKGVAKTKGPKWAYFKEELSGDRSIWRANRLSNAERTVAEEGTEDWVSLVARAKKFEDWKLRDSDAFDAQSLQMWNSGNVVWGEKGGGTARYTVGGFGPDDVGSYVPLGWEGSWLPQETAESVVGNRVGMDILTGDPVLGGTISDEVAYDLFRANLDTVIDVLHVAKESGIDTGDVLSNMLIEAKYGEELIGSSPQSLTNKARSARSPFAGETNTRGARPLSIEELFGGTTVDVYEEAVLGTSIVDRAANVVAKPFLSPLRATNKRLEKFRPYIALAGKNGKITREWIRSQNSARKASAKAEHEVRIRVLSEAPDFVAERIVKESADDIFKGKEGKKKAREQFMNIVTTVRSVSRNLQPSDEVIDVSIPRIIPKGKLDVGRKFETVTDPVTERVTPNEKFSKIHGREAIWKEVQNVTGYSDELIGDMKRFVEQLDAYSTDELNIAEDLIAAMREGKIDPSTYTPRVVSDETLNKFEKIFSGEAGQDVRDFYHQIIESPEEVANHMRAAGQAHGLADDEIEEMVEAFPNLLKSLKMDATNGSLSPSTLTPAMAAKNMQSALSRAGHLNARSFLPNATNVNEVNAVINDVLDNIAKHVKGADDPEFLQDFVVTKFYDSDPVDAWIRYSNQSHERRLMYDVLNDLEDLRLNDWSLGEGAYGDRDAVIKGTVKEKGIKETTTVEVPIGDVGETYVGEPIKVETKRFQFEYVDPVTGETIPAVMSEADQTLESYMQSIAKTIHDGDYVVLEYSDGYRLVHKDIHHELTENILKPIRGEHLGTGFARTMNTFSTGWATWATVPLVGFAFHARNAIGNIFNSALAGINPLRMKDGMKYQWLNHVTKKHMSNRGLFDYEDALMDLVRNPDAAKSYGVRGKASAAFKPTYEDARILIDMHEKGVVSAGFFQDLDYSAGIFDFNNKRLSNKYLNNLATRSGKAIGRGIEDTSRIALYVDGIEKGLDPNDALSRVHQYLFDYTDLTHTELNLKNYSRFYTWMRKNTALQARILTSTPGSALAMQRLVVHLQKEMFGFQEDFEGKFLPDWAQDTGYLFSPNDMVMARFETPLLSAMETVEKVAWLTPFTTIKPLMPDSINVPNLPDRVRGGLALFSSGPQSGITTAVEIMMGNSMFSKAPIQTDVGNRLVHLIGTAMPALPKAVREWAKWTGQDPLQLVPNHQEMQEAFTDKDMLKLRTLNFFFGGSTYSLNEEQQLRLIASKRAQYDKLRSDWRDNNVDLPTMTELREEGIYAEADRWVSTLLFAKDTQSAKEDLANAATRDYLESKGIPFEAINRPDKTAEEHLDDVRVQIELVENMVNESLPESRKGSFRLNKEERLMIAMGTAGGLTNEEYRAIGIQPFTENQFLVEERPEVNIARAETWFDLMVDFAGLTPEEARAIRPPLPEIVRYMNDAMEVNMDPEVALMNYLEGYSKAKRQQLGLPNDIFNFDKSLTVEELATLRARVAEDVAEFMLICAMLGVQVAPSDVEHFIWYGTRPFSQSQLDRFGLPLAPPTPRALDPRTPAQVSMDDINTWQAVQTGMVGGQPEYNFPEEGVGMGGAMPPSSLVANAVNALR